ncbi:hypothetical protein QYF61_021148 [Mycteria americana]|uniref:Uncharacterized protein n=1 Tax=Mycteria americana TaxID=33587 RepID=A0AAN7S4Z0_MYCAM|nr:hypothetical protein QYF61_021148 [Mycteria americana]
MGDTQLHTAHLRIWALMGQCCSSMDNSPLSGFLGFESCGGLKLASEAAAQRLKEAVALACAQHLDVQQCPKLAPLRAAQRSESDGGAEVASLGERAAACAWRETQCAAEGPDCEEGENVCPVLQPLTILVALLDLLQNSSRASVTAQLCDPVIPLAVEIMSAARDNPFQINCFIMFMCKKEEFTEEESGLIKWVLHEAEDLAKQPQLPQLLLIRLVLQTLHQLPCPSLDTLQHLHVFLVVRGPNLNTVFEVQPHQCPVQGHDHFPSPAGHTISDTNQDAVGCLGHLGTLLAHIQAAVNQHSQVLFRWAVFQPLFPKPVALHGVVVTQVQDPALGLVKPHTIGLGPSIQPVQIPLQSLPTLKQINTPAQFGVVCKLTEGALNPLVQIIDKDIKQNWPQY